MYFAEHLLLTGAAFRFVHMGQLIPISQPNKIILCIIMLAIKILLFKKARASSSHSV